MDELAKCPTCGSNVAANGECPDCDAPAEEPPWLDDYGYREDGPAAGPPADPGDGESSRRVGPPTGRVLPFPKPKPRPLTAAEIYDRADRRPEMTPERARQMIDIIESVSKARNEKQPPRLDWLEHISSPKPRKISTDDA